MPGEVLTSQIYASGQPTIVDLLICGGFRHVRLLRAGPAHL